MQASTFRLRNKKVIAEELNFNDMETVENRFAL